MAAQPVSIRNPKENRAGSARASSARGFRRLHKVKCEVTGLQADAVTALPHGQAWGACGSLQAPGRFPKDF